MDCARKALVESTKDNSGCEEKFREVYMCVCVLHPVKVSWGGGRRYVKVYAYRLNFQNQIQPRVNHPCA